MSHSAPTASWGLEYLIVFGAPENKVEVFDGRTRLVFPFADRATGERHFAEWTAGLQRWLAADPPRIEQREKEWQADIGPATLTLFPRPIELRFPINIPADIKLSTAFWRRDFWEAQPPGRETGWDSQLRHQDVMMNLWQLFGRVCAARGGKHCGRVELLIDDRGVVSPDQYYFRGGRDVRRIGDGWCYDLPDLVAEVLSPVSRSIDRGPRMHVYARAGVPYVWLLDPELEQVEEYALAGEGYGLQTVRRAGEDFAPRGLPSGPIPVDELFDCQEKRKGPFRFGYEDEEAVPEWLVPPEQPIGLEYLLLLGHPERRFEIWDHRSPCLLAFGSEVEARYRLRHFVEEACRWEAVAAPELCPDGPDGEPIEVGRFRFSRSGRRVHLDVAVDARLYRELLEVHGQRDAWDWGE
jgi:Uma2 family endonuclease